LPFNVETDNINGGACGFYREKNMAAAEGTESRKKSLLVCLLLLIFFPFHAHALSPGQDLFEWELRVILDPDVL